MAESVYIDPQLAREFAGDLRSATALYNQAVDKLGANLSKLGASWRDEQFNDFEHEVKELRRGLVEYLDASEKAVAHLTEMATLAEEYYREMNG